MKLQVLTGRKCDECNACCKTFAVPEVGKHDADWCRYCEQGKGCSIYDERPTACKLFVCAWLNGLGGEGFRPDRLGVMIDVADIELSRKIIGALHFWEMWKGALDQPMIRSMIEQNLAAGFVVLEHHVLTKNSYRAGVYLRLNLFTEEEIAMIRQQL